MSETTIHLLRHGDVENPQAIFYGRLAGFPLSDEGRRQVAAAADTLRDGPIQLIYSSPQLRARQTADIVQKKLTPTPPVRIEAHLDEVRSPYDGVPREAMEARDWDFYTGVPEQYEQPQDVLERLLRFMARVRREHSGKQVVGITHADCLALLWLWVMGEPISVEDRHRLRAVGLVDNYPATGSISTFRFETQDADERPDYTYVRPYE